MLADLRNRLIQLQEDFDAYSLGARWLDQRFDYTSGDLDYKGAHSMHMAPMGDGGWYIWRYTWLAGDLVRIQGPLRGSWTDRALLKW